MLLIPKSETSTNALLANTDYCFNGMHLEKELEERIYYLSEI